MTNFEGAFQRFIERDVLVYYANGTVVSTIECVLKEVGDGYVRIMQEDGSESIVNTAYIVRMREHPLNSKGKKKIVID